MLTRYQSIGLQSALVGGFAIQTLVSVNPSGPETADPVEYMFFTIGLLTVLCNVHVITCTLFVGNWAPGLALRGPTGSLSRAFDATMGERKHITYSFIAGLVMFVVQTVIAVWVEDGINGFSPHVFISAFIAIAAGATTTYHLNRMKNRFFRFDDEDLANQARLESWTRAPVAPITPPQGRGRKGFWQSTCQAAVPCM